MATADLAKLTAVIRTCDRPKSLRRLLRSIRRFYPQLRILVADDSIEHKSLKNVESLQLPSHSGRSACQNALLARVSTPYFLLLDDQSELHRAAHVEQLLQLVVDDKLDLAAGDLIGRRRKWLFFDQRFPQPEHGTLEIAGDWLTLRRGYRSQGDGYNWCDLTANFFVARTSKVRALGGWDPELLDDERVEFFFRAHRQGLRIGIAPDATVWRWGETAKSYEMPAEPSQKSLAVAKMGLARMTDFDGQVFKAPRRAMAA